MLSLLLVALSIVSAGSLADVAAQQCRSESSGYVNAAGMQEQEQDQESENELLAMCD